MELTDGWYSIIAFADVPLSNLFQSGSIQVGDKIRVVGATIVADRPEQPLDAFKSTTLKIHYNGCHPVPWHCPLGLSLCSQPIVSLDLVESNGGPVSRTLVCILRKYPLMYWCRLPSGTSVSRTPKAWDSAYRNFQDKRSALEAEVLEDVVRRTSHEFTGNCGKIKQIGLDILMQGGSYETELETNEQNELKV